MRGREALSLRKCGGKGAPCLLMFLVLSQLGRHGMEGVGLTHSLQYSLPPSSSDCVSSPPLSSTEGKEPRRVS